MARLDLHTHTTFSEDRHRFPVAGGMVVTIPFHPVLTPRRLYDLSLERGLTHVTVTDHDTIAGGLALLEDSGPTDRFIMGEEVSCQHLGISLHVGVYGLNEQDHAEIQRHATSSDRETRCLRYNVPQLIEYLDSRELAYDLKHPLWSLPEAPRAVDALRDILPRFGVVEGINGSRHRSLNELGMRLAAALRPDVAYTGGSDSHTDGVGLTWTECEGESPAEVVASLRQGRSRAGGEHGTHARLDSDFRLVVKTNATHRAGHFQSLADDYLRNMPHLTQDLARIAVEAGVAYATVSEYRRQRELAAEMRGAFGSVLAG